MFHRPESFPYYGAVRLAALGCLLLLPTALHAQQEGLTRTEMRRMQDQTMRDREYALYHAGEMRARQEKAAAVNLLPQMREDFKQLQLVNNGLMMQVVAAKALDYKLIAQAMGEIKNRAARLKDNLVLPQLQAAAENTRKDKAPDATTDAAQLKLSLFKLDSLIMSFVKNPQFTSANTLVMTHAEQAGRDLRDIIELSRTIRKSAQQVGK